MTTLGAVIAVLIVGVPAALFAGWLGWRGARALWLVLVNAVWPALAAALYLTITNSADEAFRLDTPVVTGLMLGATLTAFSAPLWLGGFWAGRRARQARAG